MTDSKFSKYEIFAPLFINSQEKELHKYPSIILISNLFVEISKPDRGGEVNSSSELHCG